MHRPTDALRRARATHKERDSDEDMDRTFDVDKPPYNWLRDNDDSSGDEEDGNAWTECDGELWTDDRSVAQIVAYASTFDNWETLGAHAAVTTAVVLSDRMFLVRDENGLVYKPRYRSLGSRHVGALLDGMINGLQRAKGAINWAEEFVRNEVGYSGDLGNVLGALDALELVKFDAETGSADRDNERIDAVNRFHETLYAALGSSAAHAFSAETAVAILGDLALGCSELRLVTLTLAEKIMIAQCNHGARLDKVRDLLCWGAAPKKLRKVAFDGTFARLVGCLAAAPASDKPVWCRATLNYLRGEGLGTVRVHCAHAVPVDAAMYDNKTATQVRLWENDVNAFSGVRRRDLFGAARRCRVICLAALGPRAADGAEEKFIRFEMSPKDMMTSNHLIINNEVNGALKESVAQLCAVAHSNLRGGSFEGPSYLEATTTEFDSRGRFSASGGVRDVLLDVYSLCKTTKEGKKMKKKKKGEKQGANILFGNRVVEIVGYEADDRSKVYLFKRYGSNHRPWSPELPEDADGIDAAAGDPQRSVALADLAHGRAYLADVRKVEDDFAAGPGGEDV